MCLTKSIILAHLCIQRAGTVLNCNGERTSCKVLPRFCCWADAHRVDVDCKRDGAEDGYDAESDKDPSLSTGGAGDVIEEAEGRLHECETEAAGSDHERNPSWNMVPVERGDRRYDRRPDAAQAEARKCNANQTLGRAGRCQEERLASDTQD